MDSDEDAHDLEEDTFGATTTLRSIIEDHEHTLLHATTPQTAALINTLRHQFAEHIRTTLYNTRTYALHQQAVLHSAHPPPIQQRPTPTITVHPPPTQWPPLRPTCHSHGHSLPCALSRATRFQPVPYWFTLTRRISPHTTHYTTRSIPFLRRTSRAPNRNLYFVARVPQTNQRHQQ